MVSRHFGVLRTQQRDGDIQSRVWAMELGIWGYTVNGSSDRPISAPCAYSRLHGRRFSVTPCAFDNFVLIFRQRCGSAMHNLSAIVCTLYLPNTRTVTELNVVHPFA